MVWYIGTRAGVSDTKIPCKRDTHTDQHFSANICLTKQSVISDMSSASASEQREMDVVGLVSH